MNTQCHTSRKRIRKSVLKQLVERGLFSVEMCNGDKVTDWRAIDERFEIVRDEDGLKARPKKDVVPGWTRRQLEHVGDAVYYLAARLLCHEHFQDKQAAYFKWVGRFSDNAIMGGDEEEIRVGRIYVTQGHEAALAAATERIKETDHYRNMIRWTP